MMRKLLVLGAAIVAVLSLATIAQGTEYESSHVWFFGDCENQYDSPYYDGSITGASFLGGGCRGIGIFAGDWDKESIAEEVSYEAMERFNGYWEVDYLKAINLFGGPPQIGATYGCGPQDPFAVTPQAFGGGLWIAIFSVVPCEPVDEQPQGPLLAIAYIDNDTGDGGFNANLDTTIAKLVDVDSSGTVTDGDAVVTNIYPREFDASPIGSFTVDVHILSGVSVLSETSQLLEFQFGGKWFRFKHIPGGEENYEENESGLTYLIDDLGGSGGDSITVDSGSPSVPGDDFSTDGNDSADQAFVDVEIYFVDTCTAEITTAC